MPTSLMGMPPTCGTVTIEWQPPADDGGDTVSGYTVSVPGVVTVPVGNVTSYEVTGLEVNVDYSVEVYATNCAGNGTPATLDLRIDAAGKQCTAHLWLIYPFDQLVVNCMHGQLSATEQVTDREKLLNFLCIQCYVFPSVVCR